MKKGRHTNILKHVRSCCYRVKIYILCRDGAAAKACARSQIAVVLLAGKALLAVIIPAERNQIHEKNHLDLGGRVAVMMGECE